MCLCVVPCIVFCRYNHASSWSSDGCRVTFASSGVTSCLCNHTTNFAVLMNYLESKVNHVMFSYVGNEIACNQAPFTNHCKRCGLAGCNYIPTFQKYHRLISSWWTRSCQLVVRAKLRTASIFVMKTDKLKLLQSQAHS